ncbi:MAG: oligosaccharide flippase family protein, partial [Acidimicrobiia bacterium]|nr:oligosaccharide flippase family protein [Acidimicrobiia bacterium]
MSSRRNVGLTVAVNLGMAVLNAITGIFLARLLGPQRRGELAAVLLWGTSMGAVAALGVPNAVVFQVARAREQAGRILASAAALNLLTSVLFTLVAWFVVPLALGQQDGSTKELAQLFVLVIPIYVLAGAPANALRGSGEFARWNLLRPLVPVLWLVTVLLAEITGHLSVAALTASYLASQAVLLSAAVAVGAPKMAKPFRVELHRWGSMLRFGLPGVLGTLPTMANLRLDQMLLAAFVSNDRLGLYVVAVAWASVQSPVLAAFGSVLFPRLAGEEDSVARLELLGRGLRVAVLVALALGAVVLVATPVGVRVLFGRAYAGAVPAAAILVAAGAVLAVSGVLEEAWRGLGRPTEVLWAEVGGLVVTGLLLSLLLPSLGIIGAALASLGGYLATT